MSTDDWVLLAASLSGATYMLMIVWLVVKIIIHFVHYV